MFGGSNRMLMTQDVVIKTTEYGNIMLSDTYVIPTFSAIDVILACVAFSIPIGLAYISPMKNDFYSPSGYPSLAIATSVIGLGVFYIFTMGRIFFGFYEKRPAYKVYLDTAYKRTTILKSTPEKDQIAICAAVKELEAYAIECENKQRKLETIARGCK